MPSALAEPASPTRETRDVFGWTLHVGRGLLAADRNGGRSGLAMLVGE